MAIKKIIDSDIQKRIIEKIQVNIPFTMLVESKWQDLFFGAGLNPEIGLAAEALDAFSISAFREFADRFHDQNRTITIHGPFLDLSPGSLDPKIREVTAYRFQQLLEAITVFKPITVVCHAGYDHTRYDFCRERWLEYTIASWQWMGNELHKRGTRLMLENVYETEPRQLLQILEALDPDHVGYCLDIGHLSSFGKYPLDKWLRATGHYIGQLHLHDNFGDRDSHLGMGKGSINFNPLFEVIRNMCSKPVVTLEPHETEDFLASLAYLEKSDFLSLFS